MATVYGRIAKISNVVGRSDYLNDEKRQEKIVLQKIEMQYSWQEHSSFEKEHQNRMLPIMRHLKFILLYRMNWPKINED